MMQLRLVHYITLLTALKPEFTKKALKIKQII